MLGVTVEVVSAGGLVVGRGFAVAILGGAGVAVGLTDLAVGVIAIFPYV